MTTLHDRGRIKSKKLKASALAIAVSLAATAQAADDKQYFDIQTDKVGEALKAFAVQTDSEIVFSSDTVREKYTRGVKGRYEKAEALQQILAGTGLTIETTGDNVLMVKNLNAQAQSTTSAATEKKNDSGKASASTSGDTKIRSSYIAYEEVMVTATKRESSLLDSPLAISALTGDTLEKRGLANMSDFLSTIPGVTMQDRGPGQNTIIIRGISSNPQADDSTTGVYFGETPITDLGSNGNSTAAGNGDLKMVDMARVEVLRGPQGTLYGAASLGGTVRIIPNRPNLEEFEGKVSARYSQTGEEGGDNTMLQGVINIPLIPGKLAARAVAYQYEDSGYIENLGSDAAQRNASPGATALNAALDSGIALGGIPEGRDERGTYEVNGTRLSLLWQTTENLDMNLIYTFQENQQDGLPQINTSLTTGDFQQATLKTGPEGRRSSEFADSEIEVINLVLNYGLEVGAFTGSLSTIDYGATTQQDVTVLFAFYDSLPPFYSFGDYDVDITIGELRFASQLDGPLQFVTGLYYEDRESSGRQFFDWSGTPDPAVIENAIGTPNSATDVIERDALEQKAIFGEISYAFNDTLTATVGARQFEYDQDEFDVGLGLFPSPETRRTGSNKEESYKVNISYKPTDDMLYYAQWAEGFRLGRAQRPLTSDCDPDGDRRVTLRNGETITIPSSIAPDEIKSYELGVKASLPFMQTTLNANIYHINWQGIPVGVRPACNTGYTVNAGRSTSEGIEIELTSYLTEALLFNLSASYGEAKLAEDTDGLGRKGDNLPASADYNVTAALEYYYSIAGNDAFSRIDYSYVDEYYNDIQEIGEPAGGYTQVNLKTGIKVDGMTMDLFVNNLTNADDFTWIDTSFTAGAYRLRPRTIGFNIGYDF